MRKDSEGYMGGGGGGDCLNETSAWIVVDGGLDERRERWIGIGIDT